MLIINVNEFYAIGEDLKQERKENQISNKHFKELI
jgi:hypothetical protein